MYYQTPLLPESDLVKDLNRTRNLIFLSHAHTGLLLFPPHFSGEPSQFSGGPVSLCSMLSGDLASVPPIPQQNLTNLSRREASAGPYATLRHTKQRVRFHAQVVLHQGLERMGPARAEANMHVHAPASNERRVNIFSVVILELILELRLQGERLERGRVAERHGGPAGLVGPVAVVREKSPLSRHSLEFLGPGRHVFQVRREERHALALGELETKRALFVERVLNGFDVVGPVEAVAVEGVLDGVVGGHREGNAVGGFGARERKAAAGGGGVDRVQIRSKKKTKEDDENGNVENEGESGE
nr:hypothetical protein PanWU01x14_089310 [Ipomoea batatas]